MSFFYASRPLLWIIAAGLSCITLSLFFFDGSFNVRQRARTIHQDDASDSIDDILNSTLGFQKIFVINLPSRTDHRDSMALAAGFTGIDVEYVDGVTEVEAKTLPPHYDEVSRPALGAWRAHMNIARRIVEENITSALILEDDVDWDIRLKSNLQDFARASRLLLQPRTGTADYPLDPTNLRTSSEDQQPEDLPFTQSITEPSTSPYGDISRWDLFWLGHCGTRFPTASANPSIPLARVSYPDISVPETQHIGIQVGDDKLQTMYPNHTRVVHRASFSVCSLAYAVSLPGARRMLYEFSVKKLPDAMDLGLNEMCEGINGRKMRSCLTVQPELFQHHRPRGEKGRESDIVEHEGYNPTAYTRNVRWSTKINLEKLIDGETDYIDTYPDGAKNAGFGF